jgi:hypothetical protein
MARVEVARDSDRPSEDIIRQIPRVRLTTSALVARIGQIIAEISAIPGSIAAAVDQQRLATARTTRNKAKAANASDETTIRATEVSNEAHHSAAEVPVDASSASYGCPQSA